MPFGALRTTPTLSVAPWYSWNHRQSPVIAGSLHVVFQSGHTVFAMPVVHFFFGFVLDRCLLPTVDMFYSITTDMLTGNLCPAWHHKFSPAARFCPWHPQKAAKKITCIGNKAHHAPPRNSFKQNHIELVKLGRIKFEFAKLGRRGFPALQELAWPLVAKGVAKPNGTPRSSKRAPLYFRFSQENVWPTPNQALTL